MPDMPHDEAGRVWWRDGVLYQIYPRSYMDTNADGIGDLRGITARLDHLQWLGVDGIWLDPIMLSPNKDWGYDVADYCAVDPALGTLDDADELIAEAAARGIRIILDLVPNHSSDQHAWFKDAKSSRDSKGRCAQVRAATHGECSKTGPIRRVNSSRSSAFKSASFGIALSE